jgi:shikimate kinase
LAEPATHPSRVLLIGMMGAGKSVVGALVAARLDWPHLDSDQQVQLKTGNTVAQIFATKGEAAFRAEEAQALAEAATSEGPLVVSVAGGAVLSADNRTVLRRAGLVIWLRAELATIAARIQPVAGGDHRPLLEGDRFERLTHLYAERRPRYQELADVVIDVDHLTPGEAADLVVAAYHAHRAPVAGGRRA